MAPHHGKSAGHFKYNHRGGPFGGGYQINNTALWIDYLPQNCTVAQLLENIRECGKVYFANVQRPTGEHPTAAAKLIFFDTGAAYKFLYLARTGQWKVNGMVPRVRWNRNPVAPIPSEDESRVIGIWGPKHIVNQDYLERVVFSTFYYKLTAVILHHAEGDFCVMEFQFGSFLCQAQFAMEKIRSFATKKGLTERDRALWKQVQVTYRPDPCAGSGGLFAEDDL
ncbi:hypothetical protein F5Y05DRAFT_384221 [Hypoxylon sp. FL0543]|nr:hypothetical protein F5Y05DRAFT_384221 [Hypoxylon sp. FL0543]